MSKTNQQPITDDQQPEDLNQEREEQMETPQTEETIETQEEEKSEWQVKAEEYLADLQRLQADFENYKKRQAAESKEFSAHLAKSIVSDLVPVLDNLHAAAEHVPEDLKTSPWVTGITYIEKQFEDALKNYGVTAIEAKVGDTFNPMEQEIVSAEEGSEANTEHTVTKVFQKGYKLGDRVLKPARVSVK